MTGMSQVVFAEKCGFYQTYLSRIETGQANPTLNAIEVIANALGMTVFDLFDHIKIHDDSAISTPSQVPSNVFDFRLSLRAEDLQGVVFGGVHVGLRRDAGVAALLVKPTGALLALIRTSDALPVDEQFFFTKDVLRVSQ